MCWLGFCYEMGQGCDQSWTKANEWYEKSANLGLSAAMYNLGNCYKIGRAEHGRVKDFNQAREWYTKAVAQGDAEAQTQLDSPNASNN